MRVFTANVAAPLVLVRCGPARVLPSRSTPPAESRPSRQFVDGNRQHFSKPVNTFWTRHVNTFRAVTSTLSICHVSLLTVFGKTVNLLTVFAERRPPKKERKKQELYYPAFIITLPSRC